MNVEIEFDKEVVSVARIRATVDIDLIDLANSGLSLSDYVYDMVEMCDMGNDVRVLDEEVLTERTPGGGYQMTINGEKVPE